MEERGREGTGGTDRGAGEVTDSRKPEQEDAPAGEVLRGKLGMGAEDVFWLVV